MERSSTAREALLAELIGDMAQLLDRIDALSPAFDKAERRMLAATQELTASVGPFKAEMAEITGRTKTTSIQNIMNWTHQAAAVMLDSQTSAMSASARAMVEKEVGPPLRQLAANLERLAARVCRPWWRDWIGYAATAMISAMGAADLVLYVLHR
jgi:hypothetical protein